MSQEKVDRYKAQKANRKEILKKEKRNRLIMKCVAGVIAAVLVIWIGYSGFRTVQSNIPRKTTEVEIASVSEYISGLDAEDEDLDAEDTGAQDDADAEDTDDTADGSDEETDAGADESEEDNTDSEE